MVDSVNYLNNQEELRARLLVIMKEQEKPIRQVAKEIGLVVMTLRSFISGKDTDWKRLCRIEKYIVLREKELGL